MKTHLIALILCATTYFTVSAQPINIEITNKDQSSVLLGKINIDGLSSASYSDWFVKNYQSYTPKQDLIDSLKLELHKYTITAFMGTWCGDSKREVPRFYKVLKEANYPLERLTMVGVSRDRQTYKQSPGGEEEGLNIHRVPTFIFYKNGKEVNRIVESPVATLEEDIFQILRKNYVPNYSGVSMVASLITEIDARNFQKKQRRLLPKLKKVVKNMYELNTLSNVYFFSQRTDEAIAIAKINTLLFPEEAGTYRSLGNKFLEMEDKSQALKYYEMALQLDPKNEKVKKMVIELTSQDMN